MMTLKERVALFVVGLAMVGAGVFLRPTNPVEEIERLPFGFLFGIGAILALSAGVGIWRQIVGGESDDDMFAGWPM